MNGFTWFTVLLLQLLHMRHTHTHTTPVARRDIVRFSERPRNRAPARQVEGPHEPHHHLLSTTHTYTHTEKDKRMIDLRSVELKKDNQLKAYLSISNHELSNHGNSHTDHSQATFQSLVSCFSSQDLKMHLLPIIRATITLYGKPCSRMVCENREAVFNFFPACVRGLRTVVWATIVGCTYYSSQFEPIPFSS